MRGRVIVLIVTAWCTDAAAQQSAAQSRFDAATQLEARGQFSPAADALEKLGHELPDDSFAPDALYEAAVVSEERLADPARAARLYDEVATRYPSSRLSRRARTRADFLKSSLSTGEGPLAEYESIMNGLGARDKPAATARMEELLRRHPDFSLSDRALYWLGNSYAQAREDSRASDAYLRAEQRFPSSEWALRAKKARADLLLAHHHPYLARALYHQLIDSRDALARSAGREGLNDAHNYLVRALISAIAAAYLLAFVLLQLRSARKTLRIPPFEAFYYVPVAAIFVAAAATENRLIGWSTTIIAAGGALIVWLTASASTAILARRPMSVRERLWRAGLCALAVLALTWLAIVTMGLADIVFETFRAGPERG